ncbi:MAG: DDE-type integrase/transposase/recombinase [Thermoplasmata archaeon]|nr:DDE-type integrase/transposase/recombinase [Thermoplasmata archaeon]
MMEPLEKLMLMRELDALRKSRRVRLDALGIPKSTYYDWRRRYARHGINGLAMNTKGKRTWNRLTVAERAKVLQLARAHPELSSRLLAVKITDEQAFSISPVSVYRILKAAGLVVPRPVEDMPAKKEWQHKTKGVDEIWQSDATHYFVVNWGFYKQITVQDDYSRNPLAWDLKADETAFSISEVFEKALENAQTQGHLKNGHKPMLLSDNGPGFTSKVLAKYLDAHGIKHIFGAPYHPQTQGKIERFHRSIKARVCLIVYCNPDALKQGIDAAIMRYARTPHTALKNVSPWDVYAGRKEEILKRRAEKKILTMERRRLYNKALREHGRQL